MNDSPKSFAIVVGASGGIAQALIRRILHDDANRHVIAISRSPMNEEFAAEGESRLHWFVSDNSESSMSEVLEELKKTQPLVDRLFICSGLLQQGSISPEKNLKSINRESLATVFDVNAFTPILWVKHLAQLLSHETESIVTVLSARVGSIDDNRAGGWYAYRASKSALNMLLKTAAIEHRRFAKNTRFLAFHPGTTDTALSKPFQGSIPKEKIFAPDFVAEKLLSVVAELPAEPALSFLDWSGKPVAW